MQYLRVEAKMTDPEPLVIMAHTFKIRVVLPEQASNDCCASENALTVVSSEVMLHSMMRLSNM